MNKILGLGLSLSAVILLTGCGNQATVQTNQPAGDDTKKQEVVAPALNSELVSLAEEANKTMPQTIDKETRLDKMVAQPNDTLEYQYTLINVAKADVDLAVMKKTAEPSILENVKTNPDLKYFRDKKITLTYSYKDKNGADLFKIEATPATYGAK